MRKRMTSAVWVKGIAEMLAAEGLDVRALLAGAGIDFAALDAPGMRDCRPRRSAACGSSRRSDRAIRQSGSLSISWRSRRASTWSATP